MTDDDMNLRAGEYVLGVLSPDEAAAFRRDLRESPTLRAMVAQWEQDLLPLTLSLEEVTPPSHLRERIRATLDLWAAAQPDRQTVGERQRPKAPGRERFWQIATAVTMALAASLAVLLITSPRLERSAEIDEPLVAAIAPTAGSAPLWIAVTRCDGKLSVATLGAPPRPADRDLELWALAKGATRPVPLGVLPRSGALVADLNGIPMGQLQLLVSVEPLGGSPTGLPTGPVISGGFLHPSL